MNFKEALKMIDQNSAEMVKIYIPSKDAEFDFRALTTGDQRLLAKSAVSMDNYNGDLIRFGLFDKMLITSDVPMMGISKKIMSSELSVVDMISFTASLKSQISNSVDHKIECPICDDGMINRQINLPEIIDNCRNFTPCRTSVELDHDGVDYKFILGESAWFDVVILREAIKKSSSDESSVSTLANFAFNNTCLYIKDLFINGEQILTDDNKPFCKMSVPDRVRLFDTLPPAITIDDKNENSLLSIVLDKFNTIDIQKKIFGDNPIKCPSCGAELGDGLTYDNFFIL